MDSPVPASMFAPEPSSPGAARAAAAAARLHGGFDSDCSEDGEALNGERELDLTSKVGPGPGGGRPGDPGGPRRLRGNGWGRGPSGRGEAGAQGRVRLREERAPGPPPPPAAAWTARLRGPASRAPRSRRDHSPSAPPRGTGAPGGGGSCVLSPRVPLPPPPPSGPVRESGPLPGASGTAGGRGGLGWGREERDAREDR